MRGTSNHAAPASRGFFRVLGREHSPLSFILTLIGRLVSARLTYFQQKKEIVQ